MPETVRSMEGLDAAMPLLQHAANGRMQLRLQQWIGSKPASY